MLRAVCNMLNRITFVAKLVFFINIQKIFNKIILTYHKQQIYVWNYSSFH